MELCYICLLVKLCKMCVYLLKNDAKPVMLANMARRLGTLPTQIKNRAADPNKQKGTKHVPVWAVVLEFL